MKSISFENVYWSIRIECGNIWNGMVFVVVEPLNVSNVMLLWLLSTLAAISNFTSLFCTSYWISCGRLNIMETICVLYAILFNFCFFSSFDVCNLHCCAVMENIMLWKKRTLFSTLLHRPPQPMSYSIYRIVKLLTTKEGILKMMTFVLHNKRDVHLLKLKKNFFFCGKRQNCVWMNKRFFSCGEWTVLSKLKSCNSSLSFEIQWDFSSDF